MSYLNRELLKNDLKRNPLVNLTLFLFLLLSALLTASGVLVIDRLNGSIDHIMGIAKPPHFLQMHVGAIDAARVEDFAAETGMVQEQHIQQMVNLDGIRINFERADGTRGSFSDSMLDNYFVSQTESFDFLLDTDNRIVRPQAGEIGVPVSYMKTYGLQPGDSLSLQSEAGDVTKFEILCGIRDAQMGSSLSSSVRFLLSDGDFAKLYRDNSNRESIIAFRLKDGADSGAFQKLYESESAAMPQNGQAITDNLIRLVNAIGDGLMSGLMIFLALILMLIAMLNVRFTLHATLEDEVREIGTLKAIGLKDRDIKGLYRVKYAAISGLACLLGAVAAFPLTHLFTGNIALNFGLAPPSTLSYFLPFLAAGIVFLLTLWILRNILKLLSRLTILEALQEGTLASARRKKKHKVQDRLDHALTAQTGNVVNRLSLLELSRNFKSWSLLLVVFLLTSFAIALPLNLQTTLDAPEFVRYMGAPEADLMLSTLQWESNGGTSEIAETLAADPAIARFAAYVTHVVNVRDKDGKETFYIDAGDYAAFPIAVQEGRLPQAADEIALSAFNAEHLEKAVGDRLDYTADGKEGSFTVTGIYPDITNGGYTAKVSADAPLAQPVRETYYAELADGYAPDRIARRLSETLPGVRVIPMADFRAQTLGTITDSLRIALRAVIVLASIIALLIALFFITLETARNYPRDAVLKAIGFRTRAVRRMYLIQGSLMALIGILLGVLLAQTLGPGLVGGLFRGLGFGITDFHFAPRPVPLILLGIVLPFGIALVTNRLATRNLERTTVMNLGNA